MSNWRTIPDYPNYEASRFGEIRNTQTGNILKPLYRRGNEAFCVCMKCSDGKYRYKKIAHLVASAWLGSKPDGYMVVHKNRCKIDCDVTNLCYVNRNEYQKKNAWRANAKAVCEINVLGEIVNVYPSAAEAGRRVGYEKTTIIHHCNGKFKSMFATNGMAYCWEDSKRLKEVLALCRKKAC